MADSHGATRPWTSLCAELARRASALDTSADWPREQLELCRQHGVLRWHLPRSAGGEEWPASELARSLIDMAAACLSTTFTLTQPIGFLRRIIDAAPNELRERLLPALLEDGDFASVGISHLTTSRRHLARPVMLAEPDGDDYVLSGAIPWVTGGGAARWVLSGATLADARQVLFALPTDLAGVEVAPPARMVALSATHTGEIACHNARIGREWLIAGPVENVLATTAGAGTGGWQTSALACGVARGAIAFLAEQARARRELVEAAETLDQDATRLADDVTRLAEGDACRSSEELRVRANSLALRASHAALTAAKGAGFVTGHPAGRWCREALFFLVWSCPQPVASAALCEFAGLGD